MAEPILELMPLCSPTVVLIQLAMWTVLLHQGGKAGLSSSLALSGVRKWHTTVTLNRESGLQERTRETNPAAYFLLGTWMCKMKAGAATVPATCWGIGSPR